MSACRAALLELPPAHRNVIQGLTGGILPFPVYSGVICDSRHLAAFLLLVFFSQTGGFFERHRHGEGGRGGCEKLTAGKC